MQHAAEVDGRSIGFLVGLLVGEGHFGGDGKQPQIVLRMHVRHEQTFRWLERVLPGGKLYGPYSHGGRNYYQWVARGPFLRNVLVPLIEQNVDLLDPHVAGRFLAMCAQYGLGSHSLERWSRLLGNAAETEPATT